jgi:mono/diheme cytochrome c family protein
MIFRRPFPAVTIAAGAPMRTHLIGFCLCLSALAGFGLHDAAMAQSRGETLASRWCAECHATKPGQTSPNPKAPAFVAIAAESTATEYALRVFLKTTHATMPNFKIDPADIDDLVAYIRSLAPKQ